MRRDVGRLLGIAVALGVASAAVAPACTYAVPGVIVADAGALADRATLDGPMGRDSAEASPPGNDAQPYDGPSFFDAPTVDGSATPDALPDALPDAPTAPGTVVCGTGLQCLRPAVCCATYPPGNAGGGGGTGDLATPSYSCAASAAGCAGTVITCDDTASCGVGYVCCGTAANEPTTEYTKLACTVPSKCVNVNDIFCDPLANDCTGTNYSCKASSILPGFYYCK
jgi:hypothetical protein